MRIIISSKLPSELNLSEKILIHLKRLIKNCLYGLVRNRCNNLNRDITAIWLKYDFKVSSKVVHS